MMKVLRTESIHLPKGHAFGGFCHLAKNLYNAANYRVKDTLSKKGLWMRYNELDVVMKNVPPPYDDYRQLPSACSQQVLKMLDRTWKSYFRTKKDYTKHPEKYLGQPRAPKYKPKDGEYVLVFTNQQCKIRNGKIRFPKAIGQEIATRLGDDTDLREVRVIPRGSGYTLEVVYQIDVPGSKTEHKRIASIDIGVDNIAALTDNIGGVPIAVRGGLAKSINRLYNKKLVDLQARYASQDRYTGKKRRKLTEKRNKRIKDLFHKMSKKIIGTCIDREIDTLVIGHNVGWKQDVNIGKRNNQNFVQLPYNMLISQLKYKAEEKGISVVVTEESYTSKCSFLDNEPINKHQKYMGKRIKRGLFRAADGTLINADLNGAYNIMRKVFPDAFNTADGIAGVGLHPVRCLIHRTDRK